MQAIAVAQFAPGIELETNLEHISSLASDAAARGASLIVFPEYSSFFSPKMGPDWIAAAESLDGAFVAALKALAESLSVTIIAGMLERAGERAYNTVVAVGPAGEVLTTYRKMHLYDAFGACESDWLLAGDLREPHVFPWGDLTVGVQTCYDIRFPEVTRRLVDAGADIVVVPAEWVRGPLKEQHWRTLLSARAIENTIYVAGADHAPPIGAGNSMVLDPMGVELVTIGEETAVAVAWPSKQRIEAVRVTNPALALRRFTVVPR